MRKENLFLLSCRSAAAERSYPKKRSCSTATPPKIPQSTSNGNTHIKTSTMVKSTNPNSQEVSKSRVLVTVSSIFPWLQGASPGTPAHGMIQEQNFTACVMSDQTTKGAWDEAIKTKGSPQILWLEAAVPRLCSPWLKHLVRVCLFVLCLLCLIKNMSVTQIKQILSSPSRNCLQS